jgi:hypothetical protein
MAKSWLSIRVDLIAGHGEMLWPRPGRLFVASRSHTFAQFASAIDDAFARWDRSHLHEFTRADGSRLGIPSTEDYEPENLLDYERVKLGQLNLDEQFAYVFDFGDQWEHLCAFDKAEWPISIFGCGPSVRRVLLLKPPCLVWMSPGRRKPPRRSRRRLSLGVGVRGRPLSLGIAGDWG